ncbi:beta-1,4-glucuronyltransferase 1 [Lepeophtheirus salmonis]|uniref:beta-1,4-glucuronyltransferase 1 n=1 Tax=Lepeophtheirus salmonis TaxID=72036 RepID=UPI001AE3D102|nr:beta-1,4-glucuronyltransferase 1-like [Lepeophtheirus salmonis]
MRKSIIRNISYLAVFLFIELIILIIIKTYIYKDNSDLQRNSSNDKRILLSIENTKTMLSTVTTAAPISTNIHNIVPSKGIWDVWHKFKYHYHVFTGSDWEELSGNQSTCLSTQSTVDRLGDLADLIQTWRGPLSLALFIPDIEYILVVSVLNQHFLKCYPIFQKSASIHFAYPSEYPPSNGTLEMRENISKLIRNASCTPSDTKALMKGILALRPKAMLKWRERYAYPQNLLRNLARRSCQTNWTMVSDIDMITTPGFEEKLNYFFASNKTICTKDCAFVVPTYEIKDVVKSLPVNKLELIQLVQNQTAREFHLKVFSLNQRGSDLRKWEKLPNYNESTLSIGYKIKKYIFGYEPTYISKPNAPFFDERFIGFGMTRNTQTYEMYAKNYEFYIMDNAFLCHWGFTKLKDRPSWRYSQQYKNRQRFDKFAKEIFAKYNRNPTNDTKIH